MTSLIRLFPLNLISFYSGHGYEFEESFGKEPSVNPPNVHEVQEGATRSDDYEQQPRSATTRMMTRHYNTQQPQLQRPSRLQSAAAGGGGGKGRDNRLLNGRPSAAAAAGGAGISAGSRLSVAANAGNRVSTFSKAPRGGRGSGSGKGAGGRGPATAAAARGGGGGRLGGGSQVQRSSSSSRPFATEGGPPQLRPKAQQRQRSSHGTASRKGGGKGAWFPVLDQASGRTYYVHAETNQARWEPPPQP